MTSHTPGPWIADPDDRPGMEWNIHVVQADSPDNRICFMTSNGPSEANARLIAAAPDLLAALTTLVAHSGYTNLNDAELELEHRLGNGFAPILQAARAAIAKGVATMTDFPAYYALKSLLGGNPDSNYRVIYRGSDHKVVCVFNREMRAWSAGDNHLLNVCLTALLADAAKSKEKPNEQP